MSRKGLKKHLRTKRIFRHARTRRVSSRQQIADAIPIRERPTGIEDPAVSGHWEAELILSTKNTVQ